MGIRLMIDFTKRFAEAEEYEFDRIYVPAEKSRTISRHPSDGCPTPLSES